MARGDMKSWKICRLKMRLEWREKEMKKLVAISKIGAEFVYSRKSAHAVPIASAEKICNALNKLKYRLNDGECWHVHDAGMYEMEYTAAGSQSFAIRNGCIYEKR